MRHFLLALLIALLPLRGWVGDAMAVALVAHPASHEAAHAETASSVPPVGLSGNVLTHCAEHLAQAEQADASQPPHDGHHGSETADAGHSTDVHSAAHQHKACDVCNGPAMALSGVEAGGLPLPNGLQAEATVRFASTVLPQGIKPPIS